MADPAPVHLRRWGHDITEETTKVWCDAAEWHPYDPTEGIDQCTCLDCLDEARRFGGEARRRMEQLRIAAANEQSKR